jgi:hypothetical protein
VSALIGLVLGGIAGVTCRPNLGALIGGVLSAGSCLVLFVLPAELALGLAEGAHHRPEYLDVQWQVIIGFIAMTFAGALAGAIGAWAGRREEQIQRKEGREEKDRGDIQGKAKGDSATC